MNDTSLNTIRSLYLDFFRKRGHLILPSFSLIPENDPSILLINAGMTPMKHWFTGAETPPCPRVATSQKCIRTPDIDLVGRTARHGTFFEMLGNFSFGDYFKKEAIAWGWSFSVDVLNLDPERIYVTVHTEDDEAYALWREAGVPDHRISRFGKSNFWEHGTGPCGPCSEMFYDRGEKYGCGSPDCGPGCACDRFVEYWNLVFTQYDKQDDGSYAPLKSKNIDTGAGLERIAAIVQEVDNLFEVDTVRSVLDAACKVAGTVYGASEKGDIAIRVITDHVRSSMMMIADGIRPSNEGRGYVLRRLIRRASRHGRLLGMDRPFLSPIMRTAIAESRDHYDELADAEKIISVLETEEKRFDRTLSTGLEQLQQACEAQRRKGGDTLPGGTAFLLHDTFGFPIELTSEIASESGMKVDIETFHEAMRRQRVRARNDFLEKTSTAWGMTALPSEVRRLGATVFTGYEALSGASALTAILQVNPETRELELCEEGCAGEDYLFITEQTPFYAESGGQTGDTGTIEQQDAKAAVLSTEKTGDGIFLHKVRVESGVFLKNRPVSLRVDAARRRATARNHTGTHLLHAALRRVLGESATQRGSFVSPDRLRFDFLHDGPVPEEQLSEVERLVNEVIAEDLPVTTEVMPLEQAKAGGVTALFGEKYGHDVRVVSCGIFSRELCGGTHLSATSGVLMMRILQESGIASGVRRIEAVTGARAVSESFREDRLLCETADLLRVTKNEVPDKVRALLGQNDALGAELKRLEQDRLSDAVGVLADREVRIGPYRCIFAEMQGADPASLREAGDRFRDKFGADAVIALAGTHQDKVLWLVMAGENAVSGGIRAGDLVREAARRTGGGGGGRPDMAQAGGRDVTRVREAMDALREMVEKKIGGE